MSRKTSRVLSRKELKPASLHRLQALLDRFQVQLLHDPDLVQFEGDVSIFYRLLLG
jgi:hypothetical protein